MFIRYATLISTSFLIGFVSISAIANPLPGAPAYPRQLQFRLEAALKALGPDYRPRTEHLSLEKRPKFTNRLILEASPYLLQHAHNPVNWFAWGEEAFEQARRENKPIFLSVGYATCHWCHVMERESFENIPIARYLNEHFISIKVDRERRPDVDELYMTAVLLITGRGGWPMSAFLTPERKPFFGGTYYPPARFLELLQGVHELWTTEQTDVVIQAARLSEAVSRVVQFSGEVQKIGEPAIHQAVAEIVESADELAGGFGNAPKFPQESYLMLLLNTAERRGDAQALSTVKTTLDGMARGGIYDQIGGGFHRYSTDGDWLVPHFEKMLYNQAQLAQAYLGAYRVTGKPGFARTARQTLDYVLRDMTSPQGTFYSATDADSAGREGAYFIWTPAEIQRTLTPNETELAIGLFGVTPQGNFEGSNILHLPVPLADYAHRKKMPLPVLLNSLERIREQLRRARDKRPHPLRDDKIITAWNGMMITALAKAGDLLQEPRYLQAATRAATFIWRTQRTPNGDLWRVYWQGGSSIPATQDDYAHLAQALIRLYDATVERVWLERAQALVDAMLTRFWDDQHGGFFLSRPSDSTLFAYPKNSTDGAIPSGNATAVRVLTALARRTGEERYMNKADATVGAFSARLAHSPSDFAYMLLGLDERLNGETGPSQYGARGQVRVRARVIESDSGEMVELRLAIAPHWHVNAHRPRQAYLIPTTLSLDEQAVGLRLGPVEYPQPEFKSLAFEDQRLALYQGDAIIRARLIRTGSNEPQLKDNLVPLKLRFQGCSNRECLPPETLQLQVPLGAAGNQEILED